MTNLSPAAQAVLDAAFVPWETIDTPQSIAAAALRAVADYAQRSSYAAAPSTDWGDGWKVGVSDTAQGLIAIADELEGQ
jgi:hypothetical protein